MVNDVDGFEKSAQIVEAFMAGQNDEIVEILCGSACKKDPVSGVIGV